MKLAGLLEEKLPEREARTLLLTIQQELIDKFTTAESLIEYIKGIVE